MGYKYDMNTNMLNHVIASLKAITPKYWVDVSSATGVPISTVRKVAYGEVLDPRYSTVHALYYYFRSRDGIRLRKYRRREQ